MNKRDVVNRLNPFYWSLWASVVRGSFARTGFYSEQPFYSPAKLGNVMDEPSAEAPPSQDDYQIVDRICARVVELKSIRPAQALCLEVFEGAYPGAAPDRDRRFQEKGLNASTCRREASKAKRWIESTL